VQTIAPSAGEVGCGVTRLLLAAVVAVLAVDLVSPDLEVVAHSPDGVVMGIRHRRRQIEGVQFHPESVLTLDGFTMLERWVSMVRGS